MKTTILGFGQYPVKSMDGTFTYAHGEMWKVTPTGFPYDHHWMVTDENGEVLSQKREHGAITKLALISASVEEGDLVLQYRNDAMRPIAGTPKKKRVATLYDGNYAVYDEGDIVARWLEDILERPCRLVRKAPGALRPVNMRTQKYFGQTAFQDSAPFSVFSQSALGRLVERTKRDEASLVRSIRPSIIVGGSSHHEDAWEQQVVMIGSIAMFCPSLCYRCEEVDVDYTTGTYQKGVLAAMAEYRRIKLPKDKRVFWGARLVPLETGFLSVGERVIFKEQ